MWGGDREAWGSLARALGLGEPFLSGDGGPGSNGLGGPCMLPSCHTWSSDVGSDWRVYLV